MGVQVQGLLYPYGLSIEDFALVPTNFFFSKLSDWATLLFPPVFTQIFQSSPGDTFTY